MSDPADRNDEPGGAQVLVQRVWLQGRLLTAIATILILALAGYAIFHLTSEVRYEDVMSALDKTSATAIALAIGFTGLSFFALTFYDVGALIYLKKKLPYADVALTAAAAYAVGNTAGFGPLSGGAIRYRAYSRLGLKPEEIGGIIAFVTLAFGLGLASVAALSLLMIAPEVAPLVGMSSSALRAIAILILAVLAALMVAGRDNRTLQLGQFSLRVPDSRTASRQFLVTVFDLAASASVLYVLLPDNVIGWPAFLAIYAVAVGLGVLSHVPAGLGVFETVIVAALGQAVDVDTVLGALVLYRLIYHVLPLLLAVIFVIGADCAASTASRWLPAFAGLPGG